MWNESGLKSSVAHTASDDSHSGRLGMGLGNGLVSFSDPKRGELGYIAIDILPGSQNHRVSCILCPVTENARVCLSIPLINVNLCAENSVHSLG